MAGSSDPIFDKQQYLAAILENVTDIVSIIDAAGTIHYESPSITNILGYDPTELLGKNAFTLVHPEDYARVFSVFLKSLEKENAVEKVELRFRHKDGSWRHMESCARNLLHDSHVRGIVVSSRDISERRHSENQILLQSQALNAASNGIVITDVQGTILWVNPAFTRMTGYAFEEAIGKNPRILKSGEQSPRIYEELWKTILSGETWEGEIINRRKDGSLYFEKQTITPVKNEAGDITYFIAIKHDISENKKMEAQFRQAQKMEAVGRLAGGVAHDFNNLLTIILGQSDMLLNIWAGDNEGLERIKEIKDAGKRAAALTRQLLAFSRKQIFQIRVVELNHIVKGADKMMRRLLGEDIELVTLLEDHLKPIKVDASQIDQVLMNLAVNARDAMPHGGKLVIQTSQSVVDEKMASKYPGLIPGQYVQLKFKDSGVGMSPEIKAHLFEPFFTTKEKGKGTGLGLATIYGIIKQSQSYIYAESEQGRGTSFLIFFPASEESLSEAGNAMLPKFPEGNETVLIAEDEELVRGLASQVLSRQGFQVIETHNGQEALKYLEENPGKPIHMLFTDLVMPYIGGTELAEKFSQKNPQAKIIFTSGYTDMSAVQKWIQQGSHFLQKPYTPFELLTKVRDVLDEKK